jgi:site-specific recombinase XerD
LDAGLRLKEVANLTVDDIMESPQGSYLRVRQGKGKKDRAVPLDTPKDRLSVRLRR